MPAFSVIRAGHAIRGWALLLWALLLAAPAMAVSHSVTTPHLRAELLSQTAAVAPGETFWVALRFTLQPEWHTYWRNPGDSGEAPRIAWRLPAGFHAGDIHWPYPERLLVGPLMNYGYSGEAWLLVPITSPSNLGPGPVEVRADATWLVCKEECIPERGAFALILPVGDAVASAHAAAFAAAMLKLPAPLAGPVLEAGDAGTLRLRLAGLPGGTPRQAWFFAEEYGVVAHAEPQLLETAGEEPTLMLPAGEIAASAPPQRLRGVLVTSRDGARGPMTEAYDIDAPSAPPASTTGLAAALALALAGGLLLNLMPCVFPILSLKALHLVEQSRADARAVRLGGLAFTAGVLFTFLVVAGVLLILRAGGEAVGWGFQLQSPAFVAALAWLMFALGLWLSGVWSLGAGMMGMGQALTRRGGHAGAFFTGMLAVVVATPCTAPFMGAALGYALLQPTAIALGVFLALGLGMALPWLLIALFPALAGYLPLPGAWLQRFKQLLAFPLYATAAWLVWVVSQQTDARGLALVLGGLLAVAFLAWLLEAGRTAAGRLRLTVPPLAVAGLLLLGLLARDIADAETTPTATVQDATWQPYDEATLSALRAQGRPVFVNFTAAWCITCQVNERLALTTERVEHAMAEAEVARLKADWTRRDAHITRVLEAHGRSGVPMYLFYPAGGGAPETLPSVLTEALVLERLRDARPPAADPSVQP